MLVENFVQLAKNFFLMNDVQEKAEWETFFNAKILSNGTIDDTKKSWYDNLIRTFINHATSKIEMPYFSGLFQIQIIACLWKPSDLK